MNPKWAEENLQTIRTLMERSALYRRALAPVMFLTGMIGIITSGIGLIAKVNSTYYFILLWVVAAAGSISGAFSIARRQAVQDKEPFWSAPTKRVAQALSLPLSVGMFLTVLPVLFQVYINGWSYNMGEYRIREFVQTWILFYGFALYTAGFFVSRTIQWFGIFFVLAAIVFMTFRDDLTERITGINQHLLMGFFFGVLHLTYGIYLYFTEKKNPVA